MKFFKSTFFQSKTTLCITSFMLGCLFMYFVADYMHMREVVSKYESRPLKKTGSILKNKGPQDPFQRMREMSKRMDRIFEDSFFGMGNSQFNFSDNIQDDISVSYREDENYKYIDIEAAGLDEDSLSVDVKNSMITITGERKEESESNTNSLFGRSSFYLVLLRALTSLTGLMRVM
jgi:hypothetical protein